MFSKWLRHGWIVCLGAGLWLSDRPAMGQVQWQNWDPQRLPPGLTEVERIGRSPLWVRARVVLSNPSVVQYEVLHVIYGDCPDEKITLDISDGPPRPSPEPITVGREVVMELRPRSTLGTTFGPVKYSRLGSSFVPDRSEQTIVQAITDGSAFEVRKSVRIRDQMGDAELIVRARLVAMGEGEFKWKVLRFLKGSAPTDNLILDDELFRNRAKTIVAAAAWKQSGSSATEPAGPTTRAAVTPDQLAVEAETKRLIGEELSVSREAILFLDQVQIQPDSIRAHLQYRTYDDADKKLDRFETTITTTPGH